MRCASGYNVAGLKLKGCLTADVVRGKNEAQGVKLYFIGT